VAISCATAGSTIYFTTDGSTPTPSSPIYSAPISVAANETVQAIATAINFSQSAVGSATYAIQAAVPTFAPVAGTYNSAQTVTVSTTTPSAIIYYTLDGSTPTTSSTLYGGPITVNVTETVKVIAAAAGFTQSAVGSASYVINLPQAATPTFSPVAGTYSSAQSVTITTTTASATIYYTTNGTTPTTGSNLYTGPVTVSTTETIQAIAVATEFTQSAVGSAAYTINTATGAPSAVLNVTAYAGPGMVYVRFAPPASQGSSAITSYTATTSTGYSQTMSAVLIAPGGTSYMQLNRRVDINGVPAGTPVTVNVTATNSSGTGPPSAASNSVTPTAIANPYIAVPGNQNPNWGDFSYSGTATYGVTPGTGGAPTNPVSSSDNVVLMSSGGGFQPYFLHVDPASTQGGRFKLFPYSNLILKTYYTVASPGEQIGFLKTVWVDGVATASSTTVLTDTTQNWPTNIFANAVILNVTTGSIVSYGASSNTATTITLGSGGTINAGDYYEIAVPDIAIGQPINIGNGSNPPGVIGPTTMAVNAWNSFSVPLARFNASGGNYPTVTGTDILKFGMQPTVANSNQRFFCEVGFTF
jgi:Chitobiase/beta-hexosaminidase C-terminal domain